MARVVQPCSECGSQLDVFVGQAIVSRSVVWSASFRCQACGSCIELDGGEPMPEEFRQAVLDQGGTWELVIREFEAQAVSILRTLRQALKLSLDETAGLKARLPGPVCSGTLAEMKCLELLLESTGASTELRRLDVTRCKGED